MKLPAELTKTLFYSFLFALGGAPSIAMMVVSEQQAINQDVMLSGFIGLTLVLACILLPLILLQNSFLLVTRHRPYSEKMVQVLGPIYLVLNVLCLLFWVLFIFK